MYKSVVKQRVRSMYGAFNRGNYRPLLDSFAREFAYTFVGDGHPLAGTRRTRETMEAQFQRVLRLFPGIHFSVGDIVVNGPPWNTRGAVSVGVKATLPGGYPYENEYVQLMRMRWGRVTAVRTVIDTARLTNAFAHLVSSGVTEAASAPVG